MQPGGVFVREAGDLQHGEVRIYDPECHPVTLSERNFGIERPTAGVPRIAHIAVGALDPSALHEFYDAVFGFRELLVAHAEARNGQAIRTGMSATARRTWRSS